jgi:hypothetical protein
MERKPEATMTVRQALPIALVAVLAAAGVGCGHRAGKPNIAKLVKGVGSPNAWIDRSAFSDEAKRTVAAFGGKAAVRLRWHAARPEWAEVDPAYGLPYDNDATPSNLQGLSKVMGQVEVLAWYADKGVYPANSLRPAFGSIPPPSAKWEPALGEDVGNSRSCWMLTDGQGVVSFSFRLENKGKLDTYVLSRRWLSPSAPSEVAWLGNPGTGQVWIRVTTGSSQRFIEWAPKVDVVTQAFEAQVASSAAPAPAPEPAPAGGA